MENPPDRWLELMNSCRDFTPKYPEKARLSLTDFLEFYLNDSRFKDSSLKEREWLAARDVLAGFYTFVRENQVYYNSPAMRNTEIVKVLKSYYKKFLFLKQHL